MSRSETAKGSSDRPSEVERTKENMVSAKMLDGNVVSCVGRRADNDLVIRAFLLQTLSDGRQQIRFANADRMDPDAYATTT